MSVSVCLCIYYALQQCCAAHGVCAFICNQRGWRKIPADIVITLCVANLSFNIFMSIYGTLKWKCFINFVFHLILLSIFVQLRCRCRYSKMFLIYDIIVLNDRTKFIKLCWEQCGCAVKESWSCHDIIVQAKFYFSHIDG